MPNQFLCPVSSEKIDSHVSRLTIFISVLMVIVYVVMGYRVPLYLAALDYFLRAFTSGQLSPLRFVAQHVVRIAGWQPQMIDKAPKVFASRLGFICLATSVVLVNTGFSIASMVVSVLAGSLFLLDALGIVCVGCLIYHHFVFPFFNKMSTQDV